MIEKDDNATVHVGEGVVVIKRRGRHEATACVLGAEDHWPDHGLRTIWLDRLVHEPHESTLGGYAVRGAIVTEVTIPLAST